MQEKQYGTVKDLTSYFNSNRSIFEKERKEKEHMERVMGMLSQQNMQVLEREFRLYPKGLQLPTFIYLMKKLYAAENETAQYLFVSDLIKFFQAIDINGDGHLEWSQFTEYIIENIRRVEKPRYKNKTYEENQIISSAYSKISNQYKIAKVIDTQCNNVVKKIVYVSKLSEYYLLESNTNVIKVYNDNFVFVDQFAIQVQSSLGNNHSTPIVDFSFDKQNQIFGALLGNSYRFCNMKIKTAIKFINECEAGMLKSYQKVQYLPLHQLWACVSKNGQIRLSKVNYRSRTQITYQLMSCFRQHELMVTDIVEIEEPFYICTSSMDGNIKFYSYHLKKSLEFQHISDQTPSIINSKFKKGVLGIDYTREFGSYVLSFGFSTAIYIYSLDISMTKGYTGNYNQHSGTLITARFLKAFPYVLSFDDKLSLRIWDFRKFTTIQIINCQKNFINPSKLQIIPQLSECLVCEKKVTQFRAPALEKKSKQINEFHQIFDFKLCTLTNCIFVFSSNDVRIYDYLTGALKRVFTKLNENRYETNITAAEFGHKARKFFVGDAAGFVRQYCSETGDLLQQIKPSSDITYENKQIVKIIFLREHSLLICCSLDGRILIYQRNSEGQFDMVRDIRESHEELICGAATGRYCLLATGGQDGSLNIWELQKFNVEAVLMLDSKIVSLNFSPIHPVLLAVQQTGVISMFYVRPNEQAKKNYQCFAKLIYDRPITSFFFDLVINSYIPKESRIRKQNHEPHHLLGCFGTASGRVQIVDMNPIIKQFNIKQNHQLFSIGKSIRSEVQNVKRLLQNQRKKILQLQNNEQTQYFDLSKLMRRQRIEAHSSKICQVNLIKENSVLMTTSTDKKLKLWSLTGQSYGAINFSTFKKSNWRIPELNFHKKIQQIETTLYSIRVIQNKRLRRQHQEFIKVTLLLNEYMDTKEKQTYLQWILSSKKLQKELESQGFSSDEDLSEQDQKNVEEKILESADNQVISTAEFNQIYNKLVSGINEQLGSFSTSLTHSFSGKNNFSFTKKSINQIKSNGEGLGFTSPAGKGYNKKNRNLTGNSNKINNCSQKKSEEKQYQQLFGKQMKKEKKQKLKYRNMLYSSLSDVKRSLQCAERMKDRRV